MRNTQLAILASAIALAAVIPAKASISLTFDAADSSIATGIYAFDLTGITTTPTFNSTFELLNFTTIGNTVNPLVSLASPTGWSLNNNTIDVAEWFFQNTAGGANGVFEVQATPGLSGTIHWNLAVPGNNSETANGTVTIAPIPEAGTLIAGLAALSGAVLVPRRSPWVKISSRQNV
jgi:hypothetical protein